MDIVSEIDPVRQSILTVLCLNQVAVAWLAGNKNDVAWLLGVIGAAPWIAYVLYFSEWGMVPFVLFIQFTYIRNLVKTRREHHTVATRSTSAIPRSGPA